ncbi:MAG: hypothetical protein RLZ98_305 [Pseudomonadota bacterium]|jgi:endonuclease YncB( thermonuclease family)
MRIGLAGAVVTCTIAAASIAAPDAFADPACALDVTERQMAVAVLDGETMRLADGREVLLAGILAPHALDAVAKTDNWQPADEARSALTRLVEGKDVELAPAGAPDRYGRIPAHVFLADAVSRPWVQGAMLAQGNARAYALAARQPCLVEMLAAEASARAANRGIWAKAAYAVRSGRQARALERLRGTFQVVEGRVLSSGRTKQRVYLNFGRNRWRDFAVSVGLGALPRGLESSSLEGRTIRVRGWIVGHRGPLIELPDMRLMEVLQEAPAAALETPPATDPRTIEVRDSRLERPRQPDR